MSAVGLGTARPRRARDCTALVVALTLGACLDHELPPDEGAADREVFIALQRDFADFLDWPAFELATVEHGGASGEVVVYLDRIPPSGAEEWPVGTMLVKTVEVGAPTSWVIHAMVKRGGDFNAHAALGWEYFELAINDEGTPVLLWRGEEPPGEGSYLPTPGLGAETTMEADCNACHAASSENDHVLSEPLRLEAF